MKIERDNILVNFSFMKPDESKLPPDKRSWLERPKNPPPDIGLLSVIGGIATLSVMIYFAMHPPVFDLGFGELKDFSEMTTATSLEYITQVPAVEMTHQEVTKLTTPPTITPVKKTSFQELGPIVIYPGVRVVAVSVDKRKYDQVFFYYSRNDNPSLEITSFKVEMMNSANTYSSQVISNPQKWQDTYLNQIIPTTGKDLVVVTANFDDGEVQTVLMNYI